MVRYRQRCQASFTATPTLPSPTFPTHVCHQSATSSSSTEVPSHGAQQKLHYRCLTQPRPRSSVSAQQHRNASFFANYASKWASTSTVRRSSTKTAKLLSLSLKRHASESPSLALYSRTSRLSGRRPQGHPPTSHKDACGQSCITSCHPNLHRVSRPHSRTPVRVRG